MTKSLSFTLALFTLLALGTGCSESHVTLSDSGPGGGLDAPVSPGTDGGPMPGTDSGPPTPGVDSGPPTPGVDSGPPTPGTDGGPITILDGGPGPTSDAGPAGVECGTMTCTGTDICCVTFSGGGGGGGMPMFDCTAEADCMGVTAACDGPEDCTGGDVCCASGGGGGGMGSAMCGAAAGCMFRLCHEAADCQMGAMCCPIPFGGVMASVCSTFGCF
jgi:hypothetical protein